MEPRKHNWIMAGCALAIGLSSLLFGEKILINDGAGYDGVVYCNIVEKFPFIYHRGVTDPYYAQRIAPCGIVHYGMRLLGVPLEKPNILIAFDVLNIVLLACSALLWGRIADHLKIEYLNKWLGFFALFVNFCNAKFNLFYPALTDVSAFALGLAFVFLYLTGSTWRLALATLVSAFAWPVGMLVGLSLLVFPKGAVTVQSRPRMSWIVTVLLATTVTVFAYVVAIRGYVPVGAPPMNDVWLLSVAVLFGYLLVLASLIDTWPAIPLKVNWRLFIKRVLAGSLVFGITLGALAYMSNSAPPRNTLSMFLKANLAMAVAKPGGFLVAHFVYFGPIACLLLLCWKDVVRHLQAWGLGAVIAAAAGVLLALSSESRQLIMLFPLFAVAAIAALNERRLPASFYVLFVASSVLLSKVWLLINVDGWINSQVMSVEEYLKFPWQRLFGSIGYLMSAEMYLLQALFFVLLTGAFYFGCIRRRAVATQPHEVRLASPVQAGDL
ncbi:MAG TPA: hypothetical protein VEJ63_12160 [Planctomycetota bacterium]|nr:hypothetical protein [Planctomycetota bacterium]